MLLDASERHLANVIGAAGMRLEPWKPAHRDSKMLVSWNGISSKVDTHQ